MSTHFASLALFISLALPRGMPAQATTPTPPADAANLTGLTTPIEVQFSDGRYLDGSGFFYFEFAPEDPSTQGPHWRAITHIYVVTAKHMIQPKRLNDLIKFTYALRTENGSQIDWRRYELNGTQLGTRLHLCRKEEIDVAVIDVTDDLMADMKQPLEQRAQLLVFSGANADEFPGKSPIEVQPGDDVIVIGYPNGLYDVFNKLPVLKIGVLNTPVGFRFNGQDAFLLDFKYYEGSSGSLIISKPTHLSFDKNKGLLYSADRQYAFLGIYQGEWYRNEKTPLRADLGLGWYSYNIEEAIKNPPFVH
jgi:hypothetical protein